MVIGVIDICKSKLVGHIGSVEEFIAYCDALVPQEFRHVEAIVGNQRYLCCITLRSMGNVPWDKRKEIISAVLRDTRIVGYTDTLIEAESLLRMSDIKRVRAFKEVT